jgi:hypothetical protein
MPTFDPEEFVAFLVRAKRATYASDGGEMIVEAILPGSHQLDYREGPFVYRDIYYGQVHFAGQETVFYNDAPIWSMVYAGGMLDESVLLGGVLKAALRQVSAERPYRGPDIYRAGHYVYSDASHGSVDRFWGEETITLENRTIYELRYQGGFLK